MSVSLSVSLSVCNGVAGQTVGPILTKICMWCSFSRGSDIGGSNFLWGCPKWVPILCPKMKSVFFGQNEASN